jgi:hypothetical protein
MSYNIYLDFNYCTGNSSQYLEWQQDLGLRRAHRSFPLSPSPIPLLPRVFLLCMRGVVRLWSWPDWGQHLNYVSAVVLNSVRRASWGWSPLPGAVVPCLRLWLGLAPRYQEGTLFGMYGQVITEPVNCVVVCIFYFMWDFLMIAFVIV